MRKIIWLLLFIPFFTSPGRAGTPPEENFTTGKDWLEHMSKREKFISLLPPTMVFSRYDVRLHHSLIEYIYWIDKILLRNPKLGQEDVNNIFASTIYLAEPENRMALKNMETDFLRGDYESKSTTWPRLTLQEALGDITPQNS